jgi:hypothetical protein
VKQVRLLICAIKGSIFAVETKKHKEIKSEDKAAVLTMVVGLLIAAAVSAAHYRFNFKTLSYSLLTSAKQKAKDEQILKHINLFHPELMTKDEHRVWSDLVSEEAYWQRQRRESNYLSCSRYRYDSNCGSCRFYTKKSRERASPSLKGRLGLSGRLLTPAYPIGSGRFE